LQALADWQTSLATQVSLEASAEIRQSVAAAVQSGQPTYCVGGVDVSYITPSRAVAAYVLVDLHTGELVWSLTREQQIDFPYISGYLALRELPALLPLLDEVRDAGKLADIILVDGHGTMHPRRMGIASHLGVVTGLATIGVGKTQSVGTVDLQGIAAGESRPIIEAGQTIGTALRPAGGQKPVFFSPGHRIDLETTNAVVARLSQQYRLPGPTYWADRLSREAARKS
jgi:deoxyribonuclease V